MLSSGYCFVLFGIVLCAWEIKGKDPLSRLLSPRAQQVVSELPGLAWDFLKIWRARDLIRWRSCVDLLSEVLVFVGSCVDLRRT